MEWASTLTGTSRATAESSILNQLAKKDPVAAAEAYANLTSPGARAESANQVARAWITKDQDAAMDWARTELEGKSRQKAYETMLSSQISSVNFKENFDVLLELADGSSNNRWAHQIFVDRWASTDPEAAVKWAVSRGSNNDNLISSAVQKWAISDPEAAERFAASQADEKLQEIMRSQLPAKEEPTIEKGSSE